MLAVAQGVAVRAWGPELSGRLAGEAGVTEPAAWEGQAWLAEVERAEQVKLAGELLA